MKLHTTCDGQTRRDLIKIGCLGLGGLTLAQFGRLAAANETSGKTAKQIAGGSFGRAKRAIFIELNGGPSHMDTFDLKPEASDTVRGKFKPIDTKVAGIQISEHLPKLATVTDKFAILRGVSHTLAAHQLGREYVNTGSRPIPSLEYPCYGSVVSKERPADDDIPSQVAIPKAGHGPGFLGIRYASLETNSQPQFGQPYAVRGLSLTGNIGVDEVRNRQELLAKLDRRFAAFENAGALGEGLDRFGEQAFSMITSPKARKAFDIGQEPASFAEQFGKDSFGQSCLLALRLVESGVSLVSVQLGGWDTHQDNWSRLSNDLLPKLDSGLFGLLLGLEQRGLLDSTAVMVTGEFGRTPKINDRSAEGGRDHYPRCMFMLMAGGAVHGGQVIGESDETASAPRHEGISPDDVAASFYWNLGIDPSMEYHTETGRPITLVRDGKVLESLFT